MAGKNFGLGHVLSLTQKLNCNILSVNEKLPVCKFRYFGKYIIQLNGSTTDWFGEIKQFYEPWNYGAGDVHAFLFFSSF